MEKILLQDVYNQFSYSRFTCSINSTEIKLFFLVAGKMPLMQKVPLLMREENNEDYEPKVVSFGPYHHGKEKLKFIQEFKPIAVEMFIEASGRREAHLYLHRILREIEYIRSCYPKEATSDYSDEELAQMMLQDGCVILNVIRAEEYKESRKKAETINRYLGRAVYNNINRDMYLLENQVPLRILEILFELKYKTSREKLIEDIENYSFKMFFSDDNKGRIEATSDDEKGDGLHLLEIFRSVIVRGQNHGDKDNDSCCKVNSQPSCLEEGCCKGDGDEMIRGRYAFRSVTDLKSKGIDVRASKIKSVMGIRFSPTELGRSAKLKLPYMYVDMYTRVFFKNVIAYELTPHPLQVNRKVTSYVSFMKLLVVTAEDVKDLREKKIIFNNLGSEDDVVQLYKDLNTYEAEDPDYYWDVKQHLENHYNSIIKMWMANLRSTYFSNPWTIIALVGSLFLLCLDIVQTYYAVNPPSSGGDTN